MSYWRSSGDYGDKDEDGNRMFGFLIIPFFPSISDVFTSRVSFRIVNEKFKDDLLDPSSSSYSDMQITIQRNVGLFLNAFVKWLHSITNLGIAELWWFLNYVYNYDYKRDRAKRNIITPIKWPFIQRTSVNWIFHMTNPPLYLTLV